MRVLVIIGILLQGTLGKHGFGPTDQEWGFSEVRPGANMFWWLHYTTAKVDKYTEKPLIIWLQGGPGASSTGYGNFEELGPLDINLDARNTTWVQWANILFVDNPVGCGFGYVSNSDLYAQNNTQIATDFLQFMKDFYQQLPTFKDVPLYIFSESYGGKMTAEIALVLYKAIQRGEIESNLKGIGLGDSWISPIDAMLTYGPYLFNLGFIDRDGYNSIMDEAKQIQKAIDDDNYDLAFNLWSEMETIVQKVSYGVDFYNVFSGHVFSKLKQKGIDSLKLSDELNDVMNDKVAPALSIKQRWHNQDDAVFYALSNDFMRPVTNIVEELLNTTDLVVAVYNGQLDLIVDTPGTYKWVENLSFKGKDKWNASFRDLIYMNLDVQGYYKRNDKFAFYWVNNAGHMVPADNPHAMEFILRDVTNDFKV